MLSNIQSQRTRNYWRSSLINASRTALVCIIVGCITLYGPKCINKQVQFPAFSYVTMILVISNNNATLGDTIRGLWFMFYATFQTVCPAILCLWTIGPTRLTAVSTSIVLAIASFFIALPKFTHGVAKRIALGQLVIIYVVGYISAQEIDAIMHPVHVAASTFVGVLACFLAMLFPYPHLASSQVKENSKLLAENISERLKLYMKAFCAQEITSSQALISQAQCLALKAKKFLQCIKSKQESMHWERFAINFVTPYCKNPGDRFQELETPLRGMEIALSNSQVHASILDEQVKDVLDKLEEEINQNLHQLRKHMPCETLTTIPESNRGQVMDLYHKLETPPSNEKDLPSYFFFFCIKLLHSQSKAMTMPSKTQKINQNNPKKLAPQHQNESKEKQDGVSFMSNWTNWPISLSKQRLLIALNCSLSLGLAVFFGLCYSKPNGFWSGLPVAVSFVAAREAIFRDANIKFQGTVIGNVYGVLGCFIFQRFAKIRFIALLPFFIFTSFLQQSKMYGQAGAISAVIGAILILGRRNFGPPSDFAIARIVETFIGLFCSIMVDLLLQPTRATTLAKVQLTKTLGTLHNSLSSINFPTMSKTKLLDSAKNIKVTMNKLQKFVDEAEVEPNFWFLPFSTPCYKKLMDSFTKISDHLLFMAHAIGFLEEQFQKLDLIGAKDELDNINDDIKLVGNMIATSMKSLQEIASIKSILVLEKDLIKSGRTYDIELGKSNKFPLDNNKKAKFIISFLNQLKEAFEKIQFPQDEEEIKSRIVMSFSTLGFCLSGLMKETKEVEKGIKELVQWENPTSNVNLHEILCKIHALYD